MQLNFIFHQMKKIFYWAFLACLGAGTSAQDVSTSPFSSFGVGDLLFDNNIEQAGMGGISSLTTSPYHSSANFFNPAANQSLNLTSFEFGANTHMSQFKDATSISKKSTTYISNVSLAFPIGSKARAGFGFQPYSAVGYEVVTISENDNLRYQNAFKGDGGLNSVHLMGSYNITNQFSLGVRANYLFGDLQKRQVISTEGLALVTDYDYKYRINGLQFTMGGYYSKRIGTNKKLDIGATYTLGSNLNAKITDMTTTYAMVDMVPGNIDTIQYKRVYGDMKLPQSVTFAAAFRKDLHWMIGAQLDWGDWAAYEMDEDDNSMIDTRLRASVGGYWIPDFNSYKSYFQRVVYRLGGFYEATPLQFGTEGVKKYGLTVGFGFPVGKDRDASMLNVALELGQQGNTSSSVIQENYANLKLGFTLNDIWFRKRVID